MNTGTIKTNTLRSGSACIRRTVFFLSAFVVAFSAARAETGASVLIDKAQLLLDARLRYESVNDASKSPNADALTLRARLGVQSGAWMGLSLLAEADALLPVTGRFNSTRNGKTTNPTIADPEMLVLNRLQLAYKSDFDTTVTVGRQRVLFGDQRFVGNSGWRQHEQTFDAVTLTNTSVKGLTATYVYVERVNRVFGPSQANPASGPAGAYHCDCHLFDAVYGGVPNLKLEALGILFDPSQHDSSATAQLATRKLSTTTFGLQVTYRMKLVEELSSVLTGTYAHQGNYRSNPLSIDLDYWRVESGLTWKGLTGTIGYEALQGNGSIGFSTPLATLHAYDGWADMFLSTPANGLDNFYLKASYSTPAVAHALQLDAITASLVHRDFAADRTGTGLGSEWDAALELGYGATTLLLQYAEYQGAGIGFGGFADKSIAWVQLAYKY